MEVSDYLAVLAILVALMSALYARRSSAEVKKSNDIAVHERKINIYKSFEELKFAMSREACGITHEYTGKFYTPSKDSEFYFNKNTHRKLSEYFDICFHLSEISRKLATRKYEKEELDGLQKEQDEYLDREAKLANEIDENLKSECSLIRAGSGKSRFNDNDEKEGNMIQWKAPIVDVINLIFIISAAIAGYYLIESAQKEDSRANLVELLASNVKQISPGLDIHYTNIYDNENKELDVRVYYKNMSEHDVYLRSSEAWLDISGNKLEFNTFGLTGNMIAPGVDICANYSIPLEDPNNVFVNIIIQAETIESYLALLRSSASQISDKDLPNYHPT